ncbi:MAG: LptA/OstA family protein [Rhizobiaceae bacterium]
MTVLMDKHPVFLFCLVLCLVAGLGVPVTTAQSFGDAFAGVGDNDEPVNVEADRLEILDKQKTAILTGNVRVIQGTTVVTGKEIRVFYLRKGERGKTKSGIDRIEVNGGVAIKTDENRATADKATINMMENDATLTGNVVLSQGDNIAKACSLWVDLETRHTKLNDTCNERIVIIAAPEKDEGE